MKLSTHLLFLKNLHFEYNTTKFSLTTFPWLGTLLKNWSCQLLNKATSREKLVNFFLTHEQIELVKEHLVVCTEPKP